MFAGLGALLGAVIGSFIATLVIRWPQNKSVITGRSACDHCAAPVHPRDLFPIFSFVALGGKCRSCRGPIQRDHVIIEVISALVGAVAIGLKPDSEGLAGAAFGWTLIALAALDLKYFWLPDKLTAMLALGGIVTGLAGVDPSLSDRLWGGFAGFLSLFLISVLYRLIRKRDGLGGGDPKLLGAIGLWLGWQVLPGIVLGASVIGLLWGAVGMLRGRLLDSKARIPLGTLLVIAAMCAWTCQHTQLFRPT